MRLDSRRRFAVALVLAGTLLLKPFCAWAHAIIVESFPEANSVVTGPVVEIKLRFNVRVDTHRSRLTLVSPDNGSHVINLAPQASPDLLLAKVSIPTPGKYQLRWQVLAGDGHITQGEIPFSVTVP